MTTPILAGIKQASPIAGSETAIKIAWGARRRKQAIVLSLCRPPEEKQDELCRGTISIMVTSRVLLQLCRRQRQTRTWSIWSEDLSYEERVIASDEQVMAF